MLAFVMSVFNCSDGILFVIPRPFVMRAVMMPGIWPGVVIPIIIMTGQSAGGQREHRETGYRRQHMLF
jgi:hypothetical protein